jgi:hypothetical protein
MGVRCQRGFAHEKRKLIDIVTKIVFRDKASGVDTLGIFQSSPCYSCLIDESFLSSTGMSTSSMKYVYALLEGDDDKNIWNK